MATADLDKSLGDVETVLLDSSVLIAYHNSLETTHLLSKHLLNRIANDRDSLRGFFSVVSASELLVRPYQTGIPEFAFMHTFLTNYPGLTGLPVDMATASEAAVIRARVGLRLPDAIIVASGLQAGCKALVTNDQEWKRKLSQLLPSIDWICLSDYV